MVLVQSCKNRYNTNYVLALSFLCERLCNLVKHVCSKMVGRLLKSLNVCKVDAHSCVTFSIIVDAAPALSRPLSGCIVIAMYLLIFFS